MIYYYNLADIFVLPQRYNKEDVEGFGIVFLEAGSYGLPIIAGKQGGPIEILTNNKDSILINQNDKDKLISAIKLLYTDKNKREKLSNNIKKRVLDFSSSKEQSNKLKEVL